MTREWDQLKARSVLHEHQFISRARTIGSCIARLRRAWYNVAARWGDQALIDQQTAYNQTVVACLLRVEERLSQLEAHLTDLEERQALADREAVDLTRTVGELTQHVIQLRLTVTEVKPHGEQGD